jgi:hypothetical protein
MKMKSVHVLDFVYAASVPENIENMPCDLVGGWS